MSYLNRVWVAATVAAVRHPDQGWKSNLKSLQQGKMRVFSRGDATEIRPLAGSVESDCGGVFGSCGLEGVRQNDDSLRRVMYLNCWGQGMTEID
ncbi:hypothetical protein POTOM_059639 [Populus tomentosa]|uniref:Uncharacterized protein n=3 Tax=Populus TaxID=3689 RepID=A0A8X8C291_POPTO|nr:hypothetical protein POTOM_059639 [Populus tomentosa]